MDKVYRAYIDDEIPVKSFGSQYRPLEKRRDQVEEKIPELQAKIDFLRIQYLSSDQILTEARDLYSHWPELTPEEKRKIVENITEKITIGKEDVTINLCYLPSSSEMMTSKQRKDIPALPFCQIIPKAQKPPSALYPKRLKTLGDHLRKRRLDLKLQQKEVAKKLGVSETSIYNWENNQTSPFLYFIPEIIKFLGYVPDYTYIISDNALVKTLGEKIVTSRRLLSLTQKEVAHRLGIDPSTLARWEKDKSKPSEKVRKLLDNIFTSLFSDYLSLRLNNVLLRNLRRRNSE